MIHKPIIVEPIAASGEKHCLCCTLHIVVLSAACLLFVLAALGVGSSRFTLDLGWLGLAFLTFGISIDEWCVCDAPANSTKDGQPQPQ